METPTTRSNPLQRPPSILKRSPLSPRSSQTSEIPAPPPPSVQHLSVLKRGVPNMLALALALALAFLVLLFLDCSVFFFFPGKN